MSEQIREQISAFLDGELAAAESELLLKRLTRDAQLRESFGRYALIGEALRATGTQKLIGREFAAGVNARLAGEPAAASTGALNRAPQRRWWRPMAGAAVAAGVATVAVMALQHRAVGPLVARAPVPSTTAVAVSHEGARLADQPKEAPGPYVVPAAAVSTPAVLPAARFTRYVFAHSRYSTALGHSNVLSGLLATPEEAGASVGVTDAALHPSTADGSDGR